MTFEEYCKDKFKGNDYGELKSIRRGAFNGNGLLQDISWDDLEDIWDYREKENEKLRSALEFYAPEEKWSEFRSMGNIFEHDIGGDTYNAFDGDLDGGYTARQALGERDE